jgi:hypothetical protein
MATEDTTEDTHILVASSLPTKIELCRRHVDREAACATCGAADESLFHIAFECSLARKFLEEVKKLTGTKFQDFTG